MYSTLKWGGRFLMMLALASVVVTPAVARLQPDDPDEVALRAYEQEVLARVKSNANIRGQRGARPSAIPDIFDRGSVLNVGDFVMKVTNNGLVGNPFTNISSDPSGQWRGASSIEYLNFAGIAMGAVNPFATDPNAIRRVSSVTEWRPATLDPEDRIYRSFDGVLNGSRFSNEDKDLDPLTGDEVFDEDFLDGRDNDGDGLIDEDFAAIGQQMFSCVIRDDTPQAIAASGGAERHVPLGVECRQTAWAYSISGFTNFNIVNWKFFNRSGHELDSVAIGFRVDMDCGPIDKSNFFSDDFDAPSYPFGNFVIVPHGPEDPPEDFRRGAKNTHPDVLGFPAASDSLLCPAYMVTVQGFTVADDDGDDGKTQGMPHFLLIDHTIDPLGVNGPRKVGFRAFRSYPNATPYVAGGGPTIDQQRFELMTGHDNISADAADPAMLGFIKMVPGDQKSDYSAWASIGPWLHWQPNAELECTVAIGVREGNLTQALKYADDYVKQAALYKMDPVTGDPIFAVVSGKKLREDYPALDNALEAQLAFEGVYDSPPQGWPLRTDFPGRETPIKAPPGQLLQVQGCIERDPAARVVSDRRYEWFDFDCDYCTGVFNTTKGGGLLHRTWLAASPPPNPNTNYGVGYNFTDNPDRRFAPAGDGTVTIAWDNLSEYTKDPKLGDFDFRGYKLWKVSDWSRPVGSSGPAEDDWTLLGEYRWFQCLLDTTCQRIVGNGAPYCRNLFNPRSGVVEQVCLNEGDLFNSQNGHIISPDPAVLCVGYPICVVDSAVAVESKLVVPRPKVVRAHYPVGRYKYIDKQVKNGFSYFYSVTAFDSTDGGRDGQHEGRRSAIEAEGIVPQASPSPSRGVRVVPNPYRGLRSIQERPSSWDLTPNATDPTGTHIDFFGLPNEQWTIKIFTLGGDLTATLKSDDAVNASTRTLVVVDSNNRPHSNVTRQQDTASDGQARWNLISRNGQDVVSGIYLFTVESRKGIERGKFVIIR